MPAVDPRVDLNARTHLALRLARAKRLGLDSAPDGNAAMSALSSFITQTARRVHAKRSALRRQRAADFVAGAGALVWNKIEKFEAWYAGEVPAALRDPPAKDWFAAWCYTELEFRYLDQGREQKKEKRPQPLLPSTVPAGSAPAPHLADEGEAAGGGFDLTPADVRRMAGWDPTDALILFCLARQWDKVPADLWGRWVSALGLAEPFPPDEFVGAPRSKKRGVLAAALGVSRDVIYQRWLRLKRRLGDQRSGPPRLAYAV